MVDDIKAENFGDFDVPLGGLVARAGAPLIEGDEFFREMVNVLPAAIYTTDAEGRITYFNEAAARLWGVRPSLGKSEWCGSWKLFWPDGRPLPHDQCPMALAIKEKRPIRGKEAIAERPDGSRVPFIPFPTPIYNESGALIGAVNMLVDITDRKRAEEATQRLASIVELSDDAIVSKDLNGIITTWNAGAERIFGYKPEDVIGKSITILIPANQVDEEPTILQRIRRGERIDHYETVRRRRDGTLIDVSLTVSPIKDSQGNIVGASKIARDITERKRNEAQLTILAGEAEHRAKNVLATVQAAVHLSNADTPEALKNAIEGRIQALAKVHNLFVQSRWTGADIRSLVAQELSPYHKESEARIQSSGPNLLLDPNRAQTIAVSLHEMATNAAKYGALSNSKGRIEIEWSRTTNGRLTLHWREIDGPKVKPPTRRGFGTRVMESMIRGQLKGRMHFDWRPDGLICEIDIPL